jgi:hypothetical protein
MEWPEARAAEANRLKVEVEKWLCSKGASVVGPAGTYNPEDGSAGSFKTQEAADGDRTWWMVDLHEDAAHGRRFSVGLSITSGRDGVSVYVTLETGWTTSLVMPVAVDPRCPRIVRDLFELPGRWFHGASLLTKSRSVTGFEEGEELVRHIKYADRSVPIITISKHDGGVALPDLDLKLGHDLIGLANVYVLDESASWALTDSLGPKWCCYWGAVRLFWPNFSSHRDRFSHPLWTRERLQSRGDDFVETRDRFRKQLRGILFRAAALSVIKPRDIDNIRDAVSRRTLTDLRERATSLEEYRELAESYAEDNDQLRAERTDLREQVERLQEQVTNLEGAKLALQAHLRAVRGVPEDVDEDGGIAPGGDDSDVASAEPTPGEVRFYKKVHAQPTHDVVVRVQDCGCNKWKGAHKADKAKKGIARLENDRSDWKSIHHCASCTGGGMWKVRW